MVGAPELQPLFLSIRQPADLEPAKGMRPPTVPFYNLSSREQWRAGQKFRQIVPLIGREMEVEIDGGPVEPVEPDRVPAHYQIGYSYRFEGRDDFREPFVPTHRSESSRPLIPRERRSTMSGWFSSSS